MTNPFTPRFGEIPLVMAGRNPFLDRMEKAFDADSRAPELTLLLSGARGTGKTALLAYLAEMAEPHGWISVDVTAGNGMLAEILSRSIRATEHLIPKTSRKRLAGINITQFIGLEWENDPVLQLTWRERMEDILDELATQDIGLLITVDEVLPELPEMIKLASVYQHFVREKRKVALIMAGLPFNIDTLLDDKTVSFLRRAQRYSVGRIPDFEVSNALQKTVQQGGRTIGQEALDYATGAVEGFAFMLQLVGYRMWERSPDTAEINLADAKYGHARAAAEMRERVLESTYRELSNMVDAWGE